MSGGGFREYDNDRVVASKPDKEQSIFIQSAMISIVVFLPLRVKKSIQCLLEIQTMPLEISRILVFVPFKVHFCPLKLLKYVDKNVNTGKRS